MQIAIICFCKYAANFARFLSDGSALNAWISLLIYVPFIVIDGVLPCANIKIAKQSMQALFIGTNPNCCIFVGGAGTR